MSPADLPGIDGQAQNKAASTAEHSRSWWVLGGGPPCVYVSLCGCADLCTWKGVHEASGRGGAEGPVC